MAGGIWCLGMRFIEFRYFLFDRLWDLKKNQTTWLRPLFACLTLQVSEQTHGGLKQLIYQQLTWNQPNANDSGFLLITIPQKWIHMDSCWKFRTMSKTSNKFQRRNISRNNRPEFSTTKRCSSVHARNSMTQCLGLTKKITACPGLEKSVIDLCSTCLVRNLILKRSVS